MYEDIKNIFKNWPTNININILTETLTTMIPNYHRRW